MKFLCDRCETRYSIADDRVRGKILKIRCKSCGNVITVREGMSVDTSSQVMNPSRTKQATTLAPAAHDERPTARDPERPLASRVAAAAAAKPREAAAPKEAAKPARSTLGDAARGQASPAARRGQDAARGEPVNALNAAFASAMAKPPPALEEEWYVSIDGDQSGPFSLAEAQRWVAQKAFDAELHCWSEGFDDWLPVDKVSHFRGLRKRPAAAGAPPPLPRVAGAPRAAAAAPARAPVEDEPKPLFAATMASLERGAAPASSAGIQLPPTSAPAAPHGTAARANAPSKPMNGAATAPQPRAAKPEAKIDAKPEPKLAPRPDKKPARPDAKTATASGAARMPAADPFELTEPADSATQLQAQPFETPPDGGRVEAKPAMRPSASDAGPTAAAVSEAASSFDDGDEELAIGEVSRVVNLADIARAPRTTAGPRRPGMGTGAAARMTGPNGILRSTGAAPGLTQPASPEGASAIPAEPDLSLQMAPVAKSHRRGLIALLSVAIVMVLGVVGAVILFVTTNDDTIGDHLGAVRDIDTSRPEDPLTHRPLEPGSTATPTNPFLPRPVPRPRPANPTPTGSARDLETPAGPSLRSEEIEDMARKHQDMTQRCYMRAQRGADSIIVGEVRKIAVTLTIDRDGNVSDVGLSEHAADNLGKCLIASMKGWKFRSSSGGAFRFSLNFVSG